VLEGDDLSVLFISSGGFFFPTILKRILVDFYVTKTQRCADLEDCQNLWFEGEVAIVALPA
jgi:hypothetical protein